MDKDLEKLMIDYLTIPVAVEYFIYDGFLNGKRLFKWDQVAGKVVQVVVRSPDQKKGRGHTFGIFELKESSFRSQWHWQFETQRNIRLRHTTQKLFEYHANQVFNKMMK
ncbi:hypothetical protein LCGC14_1095590 [marine sediment metagenome]|uniref:Uncharacterized protein n=1 Tax=marine sediment metagenome TaxID=412755 RepID=A0A0F9MFD6_9ZZZZ